MQPNRDGWWKNASDGYLRPGEHLSCSFSASISTTVDKSAGRVKCALAGFREKLETWQSQHHQHCNTLKHHQWWFTILLMINNRLQGSTILHTFQDDIFLAQQCWSIPCMSFLPAPCSDPNSKLKIGSSSRSSYRAARHLSRLFVARRASSLHSLQGRASKRAPGYHRAFSPL